MKFLIEFTQLNLVKFRSFIRLCNKTFSKSGIIMTIEKNSSIRVAPDPFSISDKFQKDYFETKVIEIYKYFAFIDYPLIPPIPPIKHSTYHSMDLKLTEKYKNQNNNILIQEDDFLKKNILVTFRISREELNKLDDLLQTNFLDSDHLTIKATAKPDFMNIEESKNYSNAFLSIFDKPTNAIKSGILFKPLKVPFSIKDYEDFDSEIEKEDKCQGTNIFLGDFLFGSYIKSKLFKKYCAMANKNVNKNLIIYNFKQRDPEEKADKNNLIISYLNNSFCLGYYLNTNLTNEEINYKKNIEQFKKIYKITINSDILLKMLKHFKNDDDNPDYLAIWTKALVMKTDYFMTNNFDVNENNNKNNNIFSIDGEENSCEQEQNSEEGVHNIFYMRLKTFIYYLKDTELLDYCEKDDENSMIKKEYVLNLIDNNIDDKHEELNKSFELSYNDIKDSDYYRGNENDLFFEEEEDNDVSNNEDNDEKEKKKVQKKKKNKKNKKKGENKEGD